MHFSKDAELIPISKAGNYIPGRPSRATVWRWVLRGAKGHRLESVFVGSRRYVTRDSIAAWLAAINSEQSSRSRVTDEQRERQARQAVDALRRRGLG